MSKDRETLDGAVSVDEHAIGASAETVFPRSFRAASVS
jgi:hypothetical protein